MESCPAQAASGAATYRPSGLAVDDDDALICIHNLEGRLLFVNELPTKILGYSREELLNRPMQDFLPPETRCQFDVYLQDIKRNGFAKGLLVVLTRTGERRLWKYQNTLQREGVNADLVHGIAHDITDQKRIEKALSHADAEYRSLFHGTPCGMFRATRDGAFVIVNNALVRMLGYSSTEELLGKNLAEDIYQDPTERSAIFERLGDCEHLKNVEVHWKRKDGMPIVVRVSCRAIRNHTGEIEYVEKIIEDISQERALKEQLRQAQKIEAIALLAGGIAHDFNNVLTGILGHAELLFRSLEIKDPRRARSQVIVDAAIQGRALTGQLLAYSHCENVPPGPVNLDSEIGRMEDILNRLIGENIDVEFHLNSGPGSVFSEGGLIYQVVLNLAVNARDAMPDGGKLVVQTSTISICPDRGKTLGIPEGKYALLEMSDTGCGMDMALQGRLFEPLFSTKPRAKGTGLGLYTVHSLVRRVAGHIRVQSEVGCGTTFRIYFPFSDVSPSESYSPTAPSLREGGGELVMIVEDDSKVRNILRDQLKDLGYSILCEERGIDAIQDVERLQKEVSLLIADIVLPDLNGLELVRILKRKLPHLKVLFITGYASDDVLPSDFPVSEYELLRKPFTRKELNLKIHNLLESKARL